MISDLDGSFVFRYFPSVANERTYFASLACPFKSSKLISGLDSTSELTLSRLNEINGGFSPSHRRENILPVSGSS